MAEPTIDEMIAWLDRFDYTAGNMPNAIRAILEQHRSGDERNAGCLCGVEGCLITRRLHVHQVIDNVHTVLFTDY